MNCFSLRKTWFRKRKAVENPKSDHVRLDDDTHPDLTLVHHPLVDHPLVNVTLQDLVVDNLPDLPVVDNPIPLIDSPAVDNDNPAINYPIPDLILVHVPLPDDLRSDFPLPDLSFLEDPSVENPISRSTYRLPRVEKNLLDLPNHIIIDILIRLPMECVVQCQRASKLLEILSKTPFFIRKQFPQATSVIALQCFSQCSDQEMNYYFIDEEAKKVEKTTLRLDFFYRHNYDPVTLYDSYDGFLLLKNRSEHSTSIFVIWNPTTEEQVTIPMEHLKSKVCGFYFNPHNKTYEVLLHYLTGRGGTYAFDILCLGSKLRRNIGTYSYVPRSERPPTIINGTLYWMVDKIRRRGKVTCSNSIITFEIGTNKLSTMQHGGASCVPGNNFMRFGYQHDYMHLTEIYGKLGLCVLLSFTELVLWVMNPSTKSWAKTYSVTLPQYSMSKYMSSLPNTLGVEVVNIKDGKLLIRHHNRLLLWDLDLNTHKIVEKKGFENDIFRAVIYTPCAVSLDTDKLIHFDR